MKYRVHICPVGFEKDRVCEPLLEPKADRVYLITKEGNDKAKENVEEIIDFLNRANIEHEVILCDIRDLTSLLLNYRKIFESETGNLIYVNVSTGSKISAIAGMMACMMWDGEPYYAFPENYISCELTTGFKEKIPLPRYKIDKPPTVILESLKVINKGGKNGVRKKKLIEHLRNKGLLKIQSIKNDDFLNDETSNYNELKKMAPTPAEYKAIEDRVLRPSREEWKFTIESGNGKSKRIIITEKGEMALKIFCEENGNAHNYDV